MPLQTVLNAELAPTQVRPLLDGVLEAALDAKEHHSAGEWSSLEAMQVIRTFVLAPGKRIRPTLCYWGWRGAGGPAEETRSIITAAASLELFHAFALIHDDIMDRSDTRRGQPSVYRALADLHSARGWAGDSLSFGINSAILCGDVCLAWSDEIFCDSGFSREQIAAARPYVFAMREEVIAGQYLDLRAEADGGSVEAALKVNRLKTSKYTVERPLQIGAALAGASSELMSEYSAIGIPLGDAFQLRDDLLGVFGDPLVTGKSALDDLRDGKRTVPVALAQSRANPNQAKALRDLHGDPDLDEEGADVLRLILTETRAVSDVESMIENRLDKALVALERASITESARATLEQIALAMTTRKS